MDHSDAFISSAFGIRPGAIRRFQLPQKKGEPLPSYLADGLQHMHERRLELDDGCRLSRRGGRPGGRHEVRCQVSDELRGNGGWSEVRACDEVEHYRELQHGALAGGRAAGAVE